MSSRLTQGDKFQEKNMIAFTGKKNICQRLLIVLLSFFLLSNGLKAQETSILVGTANRKMIVYSPSGIEQNRPLVISMHGRGQTMYDQKNQTQFQSVAQANNFVLVFPQSDGSDWQLWGDNDINFILAIIDEMYKRYGIDRDRVYLSGFSMGGMMTYYAATKIADKIAAFAPVTGFLMGGPDTNSSRPIPIIHVHGEGDNFVPYSRVQECLDAWIARNGCPTTAVVTKPYPADKSNSLSSMKYWGPGKEGVEIVFISVAGVGHWYSDDPNAVFTSQEIWNFCKKYSLKDGVPEFKYASVTDKNPKQIELVLSKSIVAANQFSGFTVKINGNVVNIDSVVLSDTNKLTINISESILKDNDITLSYANGNVVSVYEKKLINFTDKYVDNLLAGASPQIIEVISNINGDSLFVKFNKKMLVPADVSALALNAQYNGQINIPVQQGSFFNNDSTILSFPLGKKVYRDYNLSFTYSGNNISSADNGWLKTISDFIVTNNSNGLPVHISSGKIETDGITLSLLFSKPMMLTDAQLSYFTLNVNGKRVAFNMHSVSNNTIQFVLQGSVHFGDTATISYVPGNVKAADNGPLEAFNDSNVYNQVGEPTWIKMPGKIEAENYCFKSGMQAETTGDTGGGQNLGYIGNGDWAEYAVENTTDNTGFQIIFRLAAQSSGGVIDYYIDDVYAGTVNAPNTGNWQVYQSVSKNIVVNKGKHYLKIVAANAGFNINYIDVQSITTAIRNIDEDEAGITIYPNPVFNEMIIRSGNFKHNKIEIFNTMGEMINSRLTAGESVLRIPVDLCDGIYFVKMSNAKKYQLKKIMVVNK